MIMMMVTSNFELKASLYSHISHGGESGDRMVSTDRDYGVVDPVPIMDPGERAAPIPHAQLP